MSFCNISRNIPYIGKHKILVFREKILTYITKIVRPVNRAALKISLEQFIK